MRARSTACCAAASGSALDEARRSDIPRLFRSDAWDEAYPGRPHAARARGDVDGLGIDLRAQRNVELDVEPRPAQGSAGLLLPDRGAGSRRALHQADRRNRRLAGAVPRGRPYRALRAHVRPGSPVEARCLGDNAVTEAGRSCSSTSSPIRPGSRAARRGRRRRAGRRESPRCSSTSCAATAASCSTSSSSTTGADLGCDAGPLRGADAGREPASSRRRGRLPRDVDAGFYVTVLSPRLGARGRARRATSARSYGTIVVREPQGRILLRELWNEGQGMDADELVDQVSGGSLDLAVVAEQWLAPRGHRRPEAERGSQACDFVRLRSGRYGRPPDLKGRDFLRVEDWSPDELRHAARSRGRAESGVRSQGPPTPLLPARTLGLDLRQAVDPHAGFLRGRR